MDLLITSLASVLAFGLGLLAGTHRAHVLRRLEAELHSPQTAEEVIAAGWFKQSLDYDCPEGHAVQGELCDIGGLWVCVERIKYAEEMETPLYDVELSYNEAPDEPGAWLEVEIQNDCGYGCKIYEHQLTGRRALMHNSAYGCRR